jgi:hypothetical protein
MQDSMARAWRWVRFAKSPSQARQGRTIRQSHSPPGWVRFAKSPSRPKTVPHDYSIALLATRIGSFCKIAISGQTVPHDASIALPTRMGSFCKIAISGQTVPHDASIRTTPHPDGFVLTILGTTPAPVDTVIASSVTIAGNELFWHKYALQKPGEPVYTENKNRNLSLFPQNIDIK